MKLANITIENYRSITKAYKIGLEDLTVLVGPNNEGKSNVLRALATAMNVLTRGQVADIRKSRLTYAYFRNTNYYNWERDFPVALQSRPVSGNSVIIVEFKLTDVEREEFKKAIRSKIGGHLALKITLDRENTATVTVHKRGPGASVQTRKIREIAKFVASRLRFEHIQAVRTADSAEAIVDDLVSAEISRVEQDPRYISALEKILEVQQPILNELSQRIENTLRPFLPNIKSARVSIQRRTRNEALRKCEIHINDGTETLLQYKGDGIQSLAALGLMRHASETNAQGKQLVLAIEEPESHLHPSALHELRQVISEMSQQQQIVVTTHNPLFVDRVRVSNNVIVQGRKAHPASSVEEIRCALGVRASDNLRHAELVLVVEGEGDRRALAALLSNADPVLRQALHTGTLAIDSLGGASKLPSKLLELRTALCTVHVFLDDDSAGRDAIRSARELGVLDQRHVSVASMVGRKDCELEDWFDIGVYRDVLLSQLRIDVGASKFRSNKKWSQRMSELHRHLGRPWDESMEAQIKTLVSRAVQDQPQKALHSTATGAFEELSRALIARLSESSRAHSIRVKK